MVTKYSGWIGRFVIIGVVLVILTIGTAYVVEKRGEQVRRDTAIAVATKDAAKTPITTPQQATASKTTTNSSVNTAIQPTVTTSTATTTGGLPVTGPSLNILSILPLGFLVTVIVSFMLSIWRRRALRL